MVREACVKYRSNPADTSHWHSFISGKLNSNAAVMPAIFCHVQSLYDRGGQGWLVILVYPEGLVRDPTKDVMQTAKSQ